MLSNSELQVIREKGHLWDHCWRFFSLVAGEPFLIDGCLVHFDGTHLYLNTHSIDPDLQIDPDQLVKHAVDRFRPKLAWHSGPEPVRRTTLPFGLSLIRESSPDKNDVCMEIDLSRFDLSADKKRAKWIRACSERGFRWSATEAAILGYRHLLMVEEVVRRIRPGPVSLSLISRVGDFLRQSGAFLIEVFHADDLVAFCIVEDWFQHMAISLFSFGDHAVPGAKDYLQWAVIQASQGRGKTRQNVGYSISPGIKAFKEKWSALPVTRGYYDQLWHSYGELDLRQCHWPHRLLFGNGCEPGQDLISSPNNSENT